MSKKTKVDPKHLAKLSNLPLSKKELTSFEDQLPQILKHVDKIKSLDIKSTPPTNQVTYQTNQFRSDVIDKKRILTQKQALSNAKTTYKGYFVAPQVIENDQ